MAKTIAILTINNFQKAGGTEFYLPCSTASEFAKKVALSTINKYTARNQFGKLKTEVCTLQSKLTV